MCVLYTLRFYGLTYHVLYYPFYFSPVLCAYYANYFALVLPFCRSTLQLGIETRLQIRQEQIMMNER